MKRLGKQRVETLQILQTLTYGSKWRNHPAVKMWDGYIPALVEYGVAICEEWLARGYKDTCLEKVLSISGGYVSPSCGTSSVFKSFLEGQTGSSRRISVAGLFVPWDKLSINASYPPWFGCEDFHKAHRQILLGKNYEWYSKFGWGDKPAVQVNGKWPYLWP